MRSNPKNKQRFDFWTQPALARAARTAVYLIWGAFFIPAEAAAAFGVGSDDCNRNQ